MAKRKLADILWDAANVYLLPREALASEPPLEFSCNAALVAESPARSRTAIADFHLRGKPSKTIRFLESLGCDPSQGNPWRGLGFHSAQRLQGVRYMWLLLAAKVAEDEGIEL